MPPYPLALPPCSPSELLDLILTRQSHPTTLVVCSPEADFLSALLKSVNLSAASQSQPREQCPPPAPPSNFNLEAQTPNDSEGEGDGRPHHLLRPTLQQIAASRHVSTAFVPSVSHLRAHLAVLPSGPAPTEHARPHSALLFDKPGTGFPLLVIYGLVALHKDSSEWSVQGLGSTMAGAVEAGWRAGRRVVVIEPLGSNGDASGSQGQDLGMGGEERSGEGNIGGGHESGKSEGIWGERMPMLSGSTRRIGLVTDGGGWGGRTVQVGAVLGRWVRFETRDYWEHPACG
ncbi:MAG: hypothetical protein M1818_006178 [Claussenomyces sp. TS43310]|nr:MAG: hypothetical protein M1818_006178 [Claussenomyces sp. TS43310]